MEFIKLQRKLLRFSETIKSEAGWHSAIVSLACWPVIWSRWDNHAFGAPRCPEIDLMMAERQGLVSVISELVPGSDKTRRAGGVSQWLWHKVRWYHSSHFTCGSARVDCRVDCLQYADSTLTWNSVELGIKQKLNWVIWNFLMPKLDLSPILELLMPSQFHQISKYLNI